MKNTTTTKSAKPAVTIGATVCYRNKSGKYSTATVKDIVDGENGKLAILTYKDKAGNTVEFQKLLQNVWVYTGKRKAEKPEVTIGAEVMYRTRVGSYSHATVTDIVDSENGKIAVLVSKGKDGDIEFRKLLRNVFVRTGKRKATATA